MLGGAASEFRAVNAGSLGLEREKAEKGHGSSEDLGVSQGPLEGECQGDATRTPSGRA